MGIFVKNLYRDRNGKNEELVEDIFELPVLKRLFKLMDMYSQVDYKELATISRSINVINPFLERLYFHLCDETSEESEVNRGFQEYCNFVETTTLDKFFDSLELFCHQLNISVENANVRNEYARREANELEDFVENLNELFIRNSVPYRLQLNSSSERFLVVKISESEFVQESIQEFVRLTADQRFQGCQKKFIDAENCFAKNDFDGTIVKCNSLIEEMLCIILGKGSGTITNLIEDFLKKFNLPREFIKSLKQFPETIQHIRSTYPIDVHGKNKEVDTVPIPKINEELAEYVLSETAGLGRFIMKTYPKLPK